MQTWLQILEAHLLNRACKTILLLILKNIFDLGADVCVYGMHMCKHMPDVWMSVHTYTLMQRPEHWLPSIDCHLVQTRALSLKQKLSVLFRLTSQYLTHVMLFLCGVKVCMCVCECACVCVCVEYVVILHKMLSLLI